MKAIARGAWEVVVWQGAGPQRREFATKAEAYQWANTFVSYTAIEVYGPNGEYDGVQG